MKRLLFWGTIVAGATAAYLMYRRGESVGTIAARTLTNPLESLVTEFNTASKRSRFDALRRLISLGSIPRRLRRVVEW